LLAAFNIHNGEQHQEQNCWEPKVANVVRQDDGHAVGAVLQQKIRRRGDDGTGLD
jgi:hypothetical protein